GVDSVLGNTEHAVLAVQSDGDTLTVRISDTLVPGNDSGGVVDSGIRIQRERGEFLHSTGDGGSVRSHTEPHVGIRSGPLLSVGPILDDAALENLHQFRIEHVV